MTIRMKKVAPPKEVPAIIPQVEYEHGFGPKPTEVKLGMPYIYGRCNWLIKPIERRKSYFTYDLWTPGRGWVLQKEQLIGRSFTWATYSDEDQRGWVVQNEKSDHARRLMDAKRDVETRRHAAREDVLKDSFVGASGIEPIHLWLSDTEVVRGKTRRRKNPNIMLSLTVKDFTALCQKLEGDARLIKTLEELTRD